MTQLLRNVGGAAAVIAGWIFVIPVLLLIWWLADRLEVGLWRWLLEVVGG